MNNRLVLSIILAIAVIASMFIFANLAKPPEKNTGGKIIVVDDLNRTVILSHRPRRVVTTLRIVTDLALTFPSLRRALVGVDDSFPKTRFAEIVYPRIKQLPTVGNKKYIDYEKIVSLNPDLVIAKKQQRALKGMDELEKTGIPIVYLSLETPEDYIRAFQVLGNITGNHERARLLANYYSEKISLLEKRLGDAEKPTALLLFYQFRSRVFAVPGKGYIQNYEIMLAGATSLSYSDEYPGAGFYTIQLDEIARLNPDYIFVSSMKGDAHRYVQANITGNPALADIKAVKEHHVYPVPNDDQTWDMPTPRWILCSLWMAKIMHGELLGDINLTDETIGFYTLFYNISHETAYRIIIERLMGISVEKTGDGIHISASRSPALITRAMLPNGTIIYVNETIPYMGSIVINGYRYVWVKLYWWPEEVMIRIER